MGSGAARAAHGTDSPLRPEALGSFHCDLIAGKTREGKVVKILLDKLELIRKELKSEKVYDVIGRVFEGKSISELYAPLDGGRGHGAIGARPGRPTNKGTGRGDCRAGMSALWRRRRCGQAPTSTKGADGLRGLFAAATGLRAAVRSGRIAAVALAADTALHENRFRLAPTRPRALDPFLPLLEAKGRNHFDITFSRPPRGENGPVWIHPGEPVFDHLRELVNMAASPHAMRGAVVVDPSSSSSYLLHLASVAIVRRADPSLAAATDEVLEQSLIAVRQQEDGTMTVPIEEFLLLEPRKGGMPLDAQRLAISAQGRIEEARAFMVASVAKDFAQKHRYCLNADLASRIEFLRQGFFYEQKELVEARSVWSKRRRDGHPLAEREIARIRLGKCARRMPSKPCCASRR